MTRGQRKIEQAYKLRITELRADGRNAEADAMQALRNANHAEASRRNVARANARDAKVRP